MVKKKIQKKSEKVVEMTKELYEIVGLDVGESNLFLPGGDGGDLKCWIFKYFYCNV